MQLILQRSVFREHSINLCTECAEQLSLRKHLGAGAGAERRSRRVGAGRLCFLLVTLQRRLVLQHHLAQAPAAKAVRVLPGTSQKTSARGAGI